MNTAESLHLPAPQLDSGFFTDQIIVFLNFVQILFDEGNLRCSKYPAVRSKTLGNGISFFQTMHNFCWCAPQIEMLWFDKWEKKLRLCTRPSSRKACEVRATEKNTLVHDLLSFFPDNFWKCRKKIVRKILKFHLNSQFLFLQFLLFPIVFASIATKFSATQEPKRQQASFQSIGSMNTQQVYNDNRSACKASTRIDATVQQQDFPDPETKKGRPRRRYEGAVTSYNLNIVSNIPFAIFWVENYFFPPFALLALHGLQWVPASDPGFWSGGPAKFWSGGLSPKFVQNCLETAWFWKNLEGRGAGPLDPLVGTLACSDNDVVTCTCTTVNNNEWVPKGCPVVSMAPLCETAPDFFKAAWNGKIQNKRFYMLWLGKWIWIYLKAEMIFSLFLISSVKSAQEFGFET